MYIYTFIYIYIYIYGISCLMATLVRGPGVVINKLLYVYTYMHACIHACICIYMCCLVV